MSDKGLRATIQILRVVFIAGILLTFLLHPVKWIAFPWLPHALQENLAPRSETAFYVQLPLGVRGLAAAVSILPASVAALELIFLFQLFGAFLNGRFFDIANVRMIRRLGALLFISVPVDVVARFLMDVAFNLARAPGHRFVSVGLDTWNFQAVAIGLIVFVAGAIMQRGCTIAEENRLTI